MGKIVKYCNSCEEGFAEKFGFCPNCGSHLTAFEMNPLGGASEIPAPFKNDAVNVKAEPAKSPVVAPETSTPVEASPVPVIAATEKSNAVIVETRAPETVVKSESSDNFVKEVKETKTFAASAANASNGGNGNHRTNQNYVVSATNAANDGFYVTVIEEKNSKQRNLLLLGSLVLMTSLAVGGTIYSLFNQNLLVGSIGDEAGLTALLPTVEPPPEMEPEPQPKNNKDGGGGGGGGKEEPTPASKGRLVSQSENPVTPPSVNVPQLTNPSIPIIQETKGTIKRPITAERAGLPNGLTGDVLSNGQGSGGGIGSGRGTGIGGGIGTGEGNGNGSGSGNGNGNGNGDGNGDGSGRNVPPPPPPAAKPKPPAVTTARRILFNPKPPYTDAARMNQVTGTVTLKVTFLASGQIGSVVPVNGLPYGLTEQAIAAARAIKFEPAKKDGVPYTTTATMQYGFSIY